MRWSRLLNRPKNCFYPSTHPVIEEQPFLYTLIQTGLIANPDIGQTWA